MRYLRQRVCSLPIKMKWNEWDFRRPLCTYRLTWARRTSWRWWDEWDDTALQTHDSKLEPWRFEGEHVTSRPRRLPTILHPYEWAGKKHFVSLKLEGQSGIQTSYRARSAVRQWFNVDQRHWQSAGFGIVLGRRFEFYWENHTVLAKLYSCVFAIHRYCIM